MPQKSPIEWTDYTSNPIYAVNRETGKRGWFCEKISPGCGHCYACQINKARLGNGLDFVAGNADKIDFVLNEKELLAIIKLDRSLSKRQERKKLFAFDMTDLFYEGHPDSYIDKFFATAAICRNIDFQILTKRAERMCDYVGNEIKQGEVASGRVSDCLYRWSRYFPAWIAPDWFYGEIAIAQSAFQWPLKNVWLGVSVENQGFADKRIPLLLQTPAALRFLSVEPMLGPVDVLSWLDAANHVAEENRLHWIICGGESGPGARPFDIAWARSIVSQCKAADVPVFVKQLGAKPYFADEGHGPAVHFFDGERRTVYLMDYRTPEGTLAATHISDKKGGDIVEWPEDLRIRQMPEPAK